MASSASPLPPHRHGQVLRSHPIHHKPLSPYDQVQLRMKQMETRFHKTQRISKQKTVVFSNHTICTPFSIRIANKYAFLTSTCEFVTQPFLTAIITQRPQHLKCSYEGGCPQRISQGALPFKIMEGVRLIKQPVVRTHSPENLMGRLPWKCRARATFNIC